MKTLQQGLLGLMFLATLPALATGILMPKDKTLPPLAVKDHSIKVELKNNVARTTVEQIFINHTNRALEAIFIFPLPAGANIDEFAMMMNGRRVKGEVLEKHKARQIYTDIVRRMKDPGLIEHMGKNLFKASIFPVPARGEQKIEIAYSQVLRPDAGIAEYLYPLKTGNRASRILGNFTIYIHLESKVAVKSIYSPTHRIDVVRKSDREAKISFEERGTSLDRDFQLFYTMSEKDFGLNLITHRGKGADGYFLMMIAPKVDLKDKEIMPKDVCFVIDTSGSMNGGEKIEQARAALIYCVHQLGRKDRFNIVRFSTEVDTFRDGLQAATKANKVAAEEFIKGLDARGGTDLNGALLKALSLKKDNKRPYLVVFLTDGLPTIGVTDPADILRDLTANNKAGTRVFVWGVGHELNAQLLDQIAAKTHATTQYVKPGEDIEVKVSSFFDKVSNPVLAKLELDLAKAGAYNLYPRELSDLFKGQQLLVFGRYKKAGHFAVRLKGMVNGREKTYTYEASFPEQESKNPFIANLWASRKVGYLLDEIRQKGEQQELVNEVVRLAREFGIVTPYTSYLVVEDERPVAGPRPRPVQPPRIRIPLEQRGAFRRKADALRQLDVTEEAEADEGKGFYADASAMRSYEKATAKAKKEAAREVHKLTLGMGRTGGESAVAASDILRELKDAVQLSGQGAVGRKVVPVRVGARTFIYQRGAWVDQSWDPEKVTPVKVKYLSEAWFQLMDKDPALKKVLALGKQVLVVLKSGKAVLVTKEGKEKFSGRQLRALFK